MKTYLRRSILAVCFFSLLASVSMGCASTFAREATPTLIPTSTPERLELIGGEIDPCLLISSEEVETLLGVAVTHETMLLDYRPSCKYMSTIYDPPVLLIVSAITDRSIQKANQPWLKEGNQPISAVEAYEREKLAVSRRSEIYRFKDLENLGDQAFLYETGFLVINVLKNDVFYSFNGRANYGVEQDTLIKLVKIGLERMP